jgi:hypothetical protein
MSRVPLVFLALLAGCPDVPKEESGNPSGLPDRDGDGFDVESDCDDDNPLVSPGAAEICNGIDDNCDGVIDDDAVDITTWYADADRDGFGDPAAFRTDCTAPNGYVDNNEDCNDASADYHPGAPETGCTGPDYNCNGVFDEGDGDGDGFLACDDCDDDDPNAHPGLPEACDGVDNDCNGIIDDGAGDSHTYYADLDGDRYGDPNNTIVACAPPEGYTDTRNDCDDTRADVNPGGSEVCNGLDDDCDDVIDELASDRLTWYQDADGDGYGNVTATTLSCDAPAGYTLDATDCDDRDSDVYPGAPEYCGGVDHDCDGAVNEGDSVDVATCYKDSDGDGYHGTAAGAACTAPAGYSFLSTDCDDGDAAVNPAATDVCNDVDDDCDGSVDDGLRVPTDYASIQSAITAAPRDAHVCVAAGTYYEDLSFGSRAVTVEGTAGSASTQIIGTGTGPVVTLSGSASGLWFGGFTVSGGNDAYGAGVYAPSYYGTLEDLVISDNTCTGSSYCYGVGLYASGSMTITDVTVDANYASPSIASGYGGAYGVGAYIASSATIDGLSATNNYAYSSAVTSGGYMDVWGTGAYLSSQTGTLDDVTVTGNYVYDGSGSGAYVSVYGAGLAATNGSASWDNVTVQKNLVYGYGSSTYVFGGGMYMYGDKSVIDHLDVRANSADSYLVYGAGIYLDGYSSSPAEPEITNAIVAGNKASWSGSGTNHGYGGGFFLSSDAYPYLVNVDVYGNKLSADYAYGGGFYYDYSYTGTDGVNVSVCSNSAAYSSSGGGGAMYVNSTKYSYGQNFSYSNFYGNSSSEFSGISTLVGSKNNLGVTPGYTSVTAADSTSWNFALTAASGLKNAGDPALLDTDGTRSDIGAYGGAGGSW